MSRPSDSSNEALIVIVFLDSKSGPHDLSTYYAGQRADPNGFHDASRRIFSSPSFVLGPSGSGAGVIEFAVIGGWRGRLIDDALLAHLKSCLESETRGLSLETKTALMQCMESHRGMVAGVVHQYVRCFLGTIFNAPPILTVRSSDELSLGSRG